MLSTPLPVTSAGQQRVLPGVRDEGDRAEVVDLVGLGRPRVARMRLEMSVRSPVSSLTSGTVSRTSSHFGLF